MKPDELARQGLEYLDRLLGRSYFDGEARKQIADSRAELERISRSPRLQLAVVGETSSGKSTFINALLEEDLLAADFEPTTSVGTRLTYGAAFQVEVKKGNNLTTLWKELEPSREALRDVAARYRSRDSDFILNPAGKLLPHFRYSVSQFIRSITTEAAGSAAIDEVTIRLPAHYLAAAIDIVDTPGSNPGLSDEARERHARITQRWVESSHLAVFLLDPAALMKGTEKAFLSTCRPYLSKIFFVVNRMDVLDEDEAEETIEYVTNEIARQFELGTAEVNPYFISSIRDGGSEVYRHNLIHLRRDIVSFMQRKRDDLLLCRVASALKAATVSIKTHSDSYAAGYRARQEELNRVKIPDTQRMASSVMEKALSTFDNEWESLAAKLIELRRSCISEAKGNFAQRINSVLEAKQVEQVAGAIADAYFKDLYLDIVSQSAFDGLSSAMLRSLESAHRSFEGLYQRLDVPQPTTISTEAVRSAASELLTSGSHGAVIQSQLESARQQSEGGAAFAGVGGGAAIGFVIGGPFGAAIGAGVGGLLAKYFGPSLEDLQKKARRSFASFVNERDKNFDLLFNSLKGNGCSKLEMLLDRSIREQVGCYERVVQEMIEQHEKERSHVEKIIAQCEEDAEFASRWIRWADTFRQVLNGNLEETAIMGVPINGYVIDREFVGCASRGAFGALVAGGIETASQTAGIVELFDGTILVDLPKEDIARIQKAVTAECFIKAAALSKKKDREWCSANLGRLRELGITRLDAMIALEGIGNFREEADRLRNVSGENALKERNAQWLCAVTIDEDLELPTWFASSMSQSAISEAETYLRLRYAFWNMIPPSRLDVVCQDALSRVRSRRRRKALGRLAMAAAAAGVAVAAMAGSLPLLQNTYTYVSGVIAEQRYLQHLRQNEKKNTELEAAQMEKDRVARIPYQVLETCSGIFGSGSNVVCDWKAAMELLPELCEKGIPAACTIVGYIVEKALVGAGDDGKARRYYQKACDASEMNGCTYLAVMQKNGFGGSADKKSGAKLLKDTCKKGHKPACELMKSTTRDKANMARVKAIGAGMVVKGPETEEGTAGPSSPRTGKQKMAPLVPVDPYAGDSEGTDPDFLKPVNPYE